MNPELLERIEALDPDFAPPLDALVEIDEKLGRATMLQRALEVIALLIADWRLGLNLLRDLRSARTQNQTNQIHRRIKNALAKAKERAELAMAQ